MPLRWGTSLANFWLAISCATIGMTQMAQVSSANAASLTAADAEGAKTILSLEGEIEPGDGLKLALMIIALKKEKRYVSAIYLNSRGGKHHGAVQMAEVVKRHKISTAVADGAECASACFTVFSAGHQKFSGYRTLIGVHRASTKGQETDAAFAATFEAARIVSEFGVPPAIVGKLMLTPPNQILWLSLDDLRSMNVTLLSNLIRPAELAAPVEPAAPVASRRLTQFKPDGLSWSEYVAKTSELSRRTFGPHHLRESCNLYTMLCTRSFYFNDKDDVRTHVTTVEDLSGNVVQREVCKEDMPGSGLSCFDWDTLEKYHSASGRDGQPTTKRTPAKGIQGTLRRNPSPQRSPFGETQCRCA
jgi:hypothetical protein